MKEKDTYYDRIHQYLLGQMSDAEKLAFEQEMQAEAQLKQDVEVERILLKGIEQDGDAQLRKQISIMHEQMRSEGLTKSENQKQSSLKWTFIMSKVMAVAASVALILGAIWFFRPKEDPYTKLSKPDKTKVKILMEGLQSYGMAGVATESDSILSALKRFDAGDFTGAQKELETVLAVHPGQDTASFYLALCHINQNQAPKAIDILKNLAQKDGFEMKNEANWYLALAYLKTNDGNDEAKKLFEQLSTQPGYESDAKTALDLLK